MKSQPDATAATFVVDLAIDTDQLKRLYRGATRTVLAQCRDGRWVRFPARALRGHVADRGVHGAFALRVHAGRLQRMQRVD
jgi:Protein of unknown function (DUF2835)